MRHRKPFTMIEMLVVMAIIMVLMGILIPSVSKAMKKAKRHKTYTACRTMLMAIKQYETTYGFLPMTGFYMSGTDTVDAKITGDNRTLLLQALNADTSQQAANPRKIKFIESTYNTSGKPTYTDSWEQDIEIALDLDFDGELDDAVVDGYTNAGTSDVLKTSIAVWSIGPDNTSSTTDNDSTNTDNINSWTDKP